MPRLGRLDAPSVLHHVMGRGIEKRKIFLDDDNRNDFIDSLSDLEEYRAADRYQRTCRENIRVVKARQTISWIGVREPGYSGADVARYLGVTNSCVTRLISAGRKQDIDDMGLAL